MKMFPVNCYGSQLPSHQWFSRNFTFKTTPFLSTRQSQERQKNPSWMRNQEYNPVLQTISAALQNTPHTFQPAAKVGEMPNSLHIWEASKETGHWWQMPVQTHTQTYMQVYTQTHAYIWLTADCNIYTQRMHISPSLSPKPLTSLGAGKQRQQYTYIKYQIN